MTQMTCHFCFGNHNCRVCPLEKRISSELKKIIGRKMEEFVSTLKCPCCSQRTFFMLDDNSPSLDIICKCGKKFEVKSKCLSCDVLPDNLKIHHGNYKYYLERQNKTLDFIILIYKVDRINKVSEIRKIIHIPDEEIKNNKNFSVVPCENNQNCDIYIKNHNIYNNLTFNNTIKINFKNDIVNLLFC